MKYGKLRTLRGQITAAAGVARKNIIVSDGLVNLGLKIISLQVWPAVNNGGTVKFTSILSLDTISSGSDMNASDNRQFGWQFFSTGGAVGEVQTTRAIIEPDHIVNRDLFLTLDNSTDGIYNYLIEAQVVELSDDEAIITIIKETSQQ